MNTVSVNPCVEQHLCKLAASFGLKNIDHEVLSLYQQLSQILLDSQSPDLLQLLNKHESLLFVNGFLRRFQNLGQVHGCMCTSVDANGDYDIPFLMIYYLFEDLVVFLPLSDIVRKSMLNWCVHPMSDGHEAVYGTCLRNGYGWRVDQNHPPLLI